MKYLDMSIDTVYTNGRLCRRIIEFYDGLDGERRVKYEKGFFCILKDKWRSFGEDQDCSKKSFAKWAKEKVERSEETA